MHSTSQKTMKRAVFSEALTCRAVFESVFVWLNTIPDSIIEYL
jgi:hypothetical protein